MGELIRLGCRHDELVFFLEPGDFSTIHNRMIKFNICIKTDDVNAFLGTILKNIKHASPDHAFNYHGEFGMDDISSAIKGFVNTHTSPGFLSSKSKWTIPKEYKFHEMGICLNDELNDNKFGNVEIKFIRHDCVIETDNNPDFMIVINLHIVDKKYKNDRQLVFGSLFDVNFHKNVNEFFQKRALSAFNHVDDINEAEKIGFKPYPGSKPNLNEYKKRRAEAVVSTPSTTTI